MKIAERIRTESGTTCGTSSWALAAALLRIVTPIDIMEGKEGTIRMLAEFPLTGKHYVLTIESND